MTLLDRFTKQPSEIKRYQIDYSEWLSTGETVVSVTTEVTVMNPATGDTPGQELTVGTTSIAGGTVFEYFVSLGLDKRRYKVTFKATTSDGQLVESEIEFKVDDK